MDEFQVGTVPGGVPNKPVVLIGHMSAAVRQLHAAVQSTARLYGSVQGTMRLYGTLQIPKLIGGDPYSGSYSVVPKVYSSVTLDTKYKALSDDIKVLQIPQFEVSNESGGKTLILGEEYYDG